MTSLSHLPLSLIKTLTSKALLLLYNIVYQITQQASSNMEEIFQFIDSLTKRLSRGINDLDDVRGSMSALSEIREAEIRIDMTIGPIEESFGLLNRYGLVYSSADAERVDGLTYAWKKLLDQV